MAITNKHLIAKASRLLPELLLEKNADQPREKFVKNIGGINFVLPGDPCPPSCKLFPEVRKDPDGNRVTVFVCKRPDLTPC